MLKKTVIPANVSGGERGIHAGPGSLPSGRLMNIKGMEKQEQTGIRRVWHALQTWHCREQQVESYLQSHGLSPFLPRLYKERVSLEGVRTRELVPAVHNLLFLRKEWHDGSYLSRIVSSCPYPLRVLCRSGSCDYYEIPDSQMSEFRAVCDPSYSGTLYTAREFAEARPGQPVRVVYGSFKGLTGKLVRYKNRSYVVVVLATVGVFVHIPKWYCEKL